MKKLVLLSLVVATILTACGTGFKSDNVGEYYKKPDGTYAMNEFIQKGKDIYWFNAEGYLVKNQLLPNGMYVNNKGAVSKNEWCNINGSYFHTNDAGAFDTNKWVQDKGKWYYLNNAGIMATNTWVDGEYYVNEKGEMLKNTTTPDGQKVDKDGKIVAGATNVNALSNSNEAQIIKNITNFLKGKSTEGISSETINNCKSIGSKEVIKLDITRLIDNYIDNCVDAVKIRAGEKAYNKDDLQVIEYNGNDEYPMAGLNDYQQSLIRYLITDEDLEDYKQGRYYDLLVKELENKFIHEGNKWYIKGDANHDLRYRCSFHYQQNRKEKIEVPEFKNPYIEVGYDTSRGRDRMVSLDDEGYEEFVCYETVIENGSPKLKLLLDGVMYKEKSFDCQIFMCMD